MESSSTAQAHNAAGMREEKMVGRKESISYAFADFGQQLIWGTIGTYLTFFYTDVFGLAAASLTLLFLVTRFWDAANDIAMGLIADRSPYRKSGKYSPYIKWGVFPLALSVILLFTTPDLGYNGKLIWAYVTYLITTAAFTVVNIPYNALLPSMTNNFQERTSLTAKRMTFMMMAAILLNVLTRPLYLALGKGNNALGMQLTIIIYMIVAIPLIFNGAVQSKERIRVEKKKEKIPFAQAKKAFTLPWLIIVIMSFCMWTSQTLRLSSMIYYLQYVVGKPALVSLFAPISMICIVPAIMITPKLCKLLKSKRMVVIIGNLIAIGGTVVILFGTTNITLLIVGAILGGIGFGPQTALTYSMMADTIDYGEWKSGIRVQALLSSAGTFGTKLGTAIGGIILTMALTIGGYVANQVQTEAALTAIKAATIYVPIITMAITIIALLFYKLDGAFYQRIKLELEQRRSIDAQASTAK